MILLSKWNNWKSIKIAVQIMSRVERHVLPTDLFQWASSQSGETCLTHRLVSMSQQSEWRDMSYPQTCFNEPAVRVERHVLPTDLFQWASSQSGEIRLVSMSQQSEWRDMSYPQTCFNEPAVRVERHERHVLPTDLFQWASSQSGETCLTHRLVSMSQQSEWRDMSYPQTCFNEPAVLQLSDFFFIGK